MSMYSYKGGYPTPLPFSITLPSGFTRTDPTTFTSEEIALAGYTGPFTEPRYDPTTQFLDWVDGSFIIRSLPPTLPQPDWTLFSTSLLSDPNLKSSLMAAWSVEATSVLALPATLLSVSQGGDPAIFFGAWDKLVAGNLVSQTLLNSIVQLASQCRLPEAFITRINYPFSLISSSAKTEQISSSGTVPQVPPRK